MGGQSFGPDNTAHRLTTPKLLQVQEHLKSTLGDLFERMGHFRFFHDKVTHGDIDVLCQWVSPPWALSGGMMEPDNAAARDDYCRMIAERTGAIQTRTSGGRRGFLEIHLALPCALFGDVQDNTAGFFQADLLLCPAKNFDFRLFMGSYSLTGVILGQAVRALAYEFTARDDEFVIKHKAVDETPDIDLILTDDVKKYTAWLGLDFSPWADGFATEAEYWAWLTDVPDRSKLAFAFTKLAEKWRGGYVVPPGCRPRTAEAVRFYAYLQTTIWAPFPIIDSSDHETSSSTPLVPTMVADQAVRPRGPYPLGIEVKDITDLNVLRFELEKPSRHELKREAIWALNHFGVRNEYFKLIELRREDKKLILRNRLQKLEAQRAWDDMAWYKKLVVYIRWTVVGSVRRILRTRIARATSQPK